MVLSFHKWGCNPPVNASKGQADRQAGIGFRVTHKGHEDLSPAVPNVRGSVGRALRDQYLQDSEGAGPLWARELVAGNKRRAAMQEAVPGTFEMQRHRLIFFTWNAGHLTRSGSEPFSATRTHSLLMEYLFSVHCQILLLQEANLLDAVSQSDAQAQAQGAILRRDPHFASKKEDAAAVLCKYFGP